MENMEIKFNKKDMGDKIHIIHIANVGDVENVSIIFQVSNIIHIFNKICILICKRYYIWIFSVLFFMFSTFATFAEDPP